MQFSAVYCHSYRFIMSLHYSRHTLLHPRPSSHSVRSSSATIHSWQPNQPSIDRVPCAFRQQQPKWIIIWVWRSESMEGSFCDCKRIVLAINYDPVTHYKTHWIDRVQPPSPSLHSDSPCQLGNQTNRIQWLWQGKGTGDRPLRGVCSLEPCTGRSCLAWHAGHPVVSGPLSVVGTGQYYAIDQVRPPLVDGPLQPQTIVLLWRIFKSGGPLSVINWLSKSV